MNPFHWASAKFLVTWTRRRSSTTGRINLLHFGWFFATGNTLVQKLKIQVWCVYFSLSAVVRFFALSSTICLNWFVYYAEPAYAKASKSSPFRSEVATNRFGGVHFFWEVCFGAEVVLHEGRVADIFIEHVWTPSLVQIKFYWVVPLIACACGGWCNPTSLGYFGPLFKVKLLSAFFIRFLGGSLDCRIMFQHSCHPFTRPSRSKRFWSNGIVWYIDKPLHRDASRRFWSTFCETLDSLSNRDQVSPPGARWSSRGHIPSRYTCDDNRKKPLKNEGLGELSPYISTRRARYVEETIKLWPNTWRKPAIELVSRVRSHRLWVSFVNFWLDNNRPAGRLRRRSSKKLPVFGTIFRELIGPQTTLLKKYADIKT